MAFTIAACGRSAGEPVSSASIPAPRPATTQAPAGPDTTPHESTTSESAVLPIPTTTIPPAFFGGLAMVDVETRASFPVLVAAPAGDDRIFIVGKEGTVWVQPQTGGSETLALDITNQVSTGNEQGLLGLAFHPDFEATRRAFLSYTDVNGDTVLSEAMVGDDAIFSGEVVLLTISQPAANHNGGMIEFGPDGNLYMALGDGGGANDQFGNGQDPSTLLGSLLRLDIAESGTVRAAADNPFVNGGGAPEVWAFGLRNPWRFTFDEGTLYVADVGQDIYEEIDMVDAGRSGLNYGWSKMEGLHCFSPASGCASAGLIQPVLEIAHGDAETCSITGGFVYRGAEIPEIDGDYFYSDYCGGYLRSLTVENGSVVDHVDWSDQVGPLGRVTSFGRDGLGELYITSADGTVRRLVAVR